MPYVLSCPTCLVFLCALVSHLPRALHALVPHVLRSIRALVLDALSCLTCLVPYVPGASRVVRTLVPYMSSVLHFLVLLVPLAARIFLLLFHVLWLFCFGLLLLLLFKFFTACTKVNHCDMPFLKKERHYNGFSYKWYKFPRSINLTTLTNFRPLVSFYSHWKH